MENLSFNKCRVILKGLLCSILFFSFTVECFSQFNSKQFPVPAYQTYKERYNALEKLWRDSPLVLNGGISTEAEHAGIKLYYDPSNQKIKDSLYIIMAKQPIMSSFAFGNFSVLKGYFVGKQAFTSSTDQQKWLNYLRLANYTTGYIGSATGKYMHWTATYLMCQEWPNFIDSAGNTAAQLLPMAKLELEKILSESFHVGDEEQGDFNYQGVSLIAAKTLATYCNDPSLKAKAENAYYAMLVHIAEGWNNGYFTYPGSRVRAFAPPLNPFNPQGVQQIGWVLFGDNCGLKANPDWRSWLFTFPSYLNDNIPAPLINLGQQRSDTLTIYGSLFTYAKKQIWHSKSYSMASSWSSGWIENTWIDAGIFDQVLKWQSPVTGSILRVSHENYLTPNAKTNTKSLYGHGHNPYSRTFQYKATQMGMCNVPPAYIFRKQYVTFSNTGAIITRKDTSNWVFCNGGTTFFAVQFLKKYTWGKDSVSGYDLILSDFSKNGWVLETAEESRYQQSGTTNAQRFNAFVKDILTNTSSNTTKINDSLPTISYKSIYGYTMEMQYDVSKADNGFRIRKVNGKDVMPYNSYPTEGSSNNLVYQRRLGDTLILNGANQQTLIIWDKLLTANSTCSATITSSSNSICAGASVALSANTGKSYKWYNGSIQVGTAPTYIATSAGLYTVEVTNSIGCKTISAAKTIVVNPTPVVSITSPANNAILTTDIFPINATVTGTNIGNVAFYNGSILLGTDINSPYSFTTPSLANGTYTFSAIAKNISNCTDTAKVTVKVNKTITGLDDAPEENEKLSVSPNPFQHHFIIEKTGLFDYSITDSKGVVVESGKAEKTKVMGENLSQGLYIISISNANGSKRISVIKQ